MGAEYGAKHKKSAWTEVRHSTTIFASLDGPPPHEPRSGVMWWWGFLLVKAVLWSTPTQTFEK
jgi:hypothetical protein